VSGGHERSIDFASLKTLTGLRKEEASRKGDLMPESQISAQGTAQVRAVRGERERAGDVSEELQQESI
jgi:hypothetical protein